MSFVWSFCFCMTSKNVRYMMRVCQLRYGDPWSCQNVNVRTRRLFLLFLLFFFIRHALFLMRKVVLEWIVFAIHHISVRRSDTTNRFQLHKHATNAKRTSDWAATSSCSCDSPWCSGSSSLSSSSSSSSSSSRPLVIWGGETNSCCNYWF